MSSPGDQIVVPESADAVFATPGLWQAQLTRLVAGVGPTARIAMGCGVAVAMRAFVMLLNKLPIAGTSASMTEPRFVSVGILLAAVGMIAGLVMASRRGDSRDLPAAAFAGGLLGLLASAVWFAVLQSIEPALGSWSGSIGAIGLASGALGVLVAMISLWAFPYRSNEPEGAQMNTWGRGYRRIPAFPILRCRSRLRPAIVWSGGFASADRAASYNGAIVSFGAFASADRAASYNGAIVSFGAFASADRAASYNPAIVSSGGFASADRAASYNGTHPNAFVRFWDGEPAGKRRHDPARTDPRPVVAKSCDLLGWRVEGSKERFCRARGNGCARPFPPL